MKEKKEFAQAKAVYKLDENENIVEEYASVNEAARRNGVSPSTISSSIHRGTRFKGFLFDHAKNRKKPIEMPRREPYFKHMEHVPYRRKEGQGENKEG